MCQQLDQNQWSQHQSHVAQISSSIWYYDCEQVASNWATVCQSYYVIVTSTKYSWKQQKSIFSKSGGGATRLNKNEIKARKNPFELFNKGGRRNKTGHSITLS